MSCHSHKFRILSNKLLQISQTATMAFLSQIQLGLSELSGNELFPSPMPLLWCRTCLGHGDVSYLHSGPNDALRPRVLGLARGSVQSNRPLTVETFCHLPFSVTAPALASPSGYCCAYTRTAWETAWGVATAHPACIDLNSSVNLQSSLRTTLISHHFCPSPNTSTMSTNMNQVPSDYSLAGDSIC